MNRNGVVVAVAITLARGSTIRVRVRAPTTLSPIAGAMAALVAFEDQLDRWQARLDRVEQRLDALAVELADLASGLAALEAALVAHQDTSA